jgi:hypothetical protein
MISWMRWFPIVTAGKRFAVSDVDYARTPERVRRAVEQIKDVTQQLNEAQENVDMLTAKLMEEPTQPLGSLRP